MFELKDFPEELRDKSNHALLNGLMRGVEREALRVNGRAELSQSPHPSGLGSALCHPLITTDFSEALLEFITPPSHRRDELLEKLGQIQCFTSSQLNDELLWAMSMPCILPGEQHIPVARYGDSHNGQMKTIYRLGLGQRYGRSMQTVAGLHYNFSLPPAFWAHFHHKENSLETLDRYRNQRYFSLIRNFRRHYWLLVLLFGASPAMDKSFVNGRKHTLEQSDDGQSLYLPWATSLRMGDLGYQSSAQDELFVCYNQKNTYIQTLAKAILENHPAYENLPLKDQQGHYQQLSRGLLQIENEFYSSIRPKRSARPGETALTALHRRGVEYIEVRCLDVDPFEALGITAGQSAFIDCFLLWCALAPSPESNMEETALIAHNHRLVINEGRRPGVKLKHLEHGDLALKDWADALVEAMQPIASMLDQANDTREHSAALSQQQKVLNNLELSPSARLLKKMEKQSFVDVGLEQSRHNQLELQKRSVCEGQAQRFNDMAEKSHSAQQKLEHASAGEFDEFLKRYYKQYKKLLA
ncbi:glutamate--cysteine ligase [Agaribacterium haliotis]|uniref:glutamate--cysteine ligase n=1 Tax=Agaribacterium haliotis TaxID=2013869 RepID=UPI000BB552D3|nr:glutamate--cysteine ligase [Agaribacterium haliotis]